MHSFYFFFSQTEKVLIRQQMADGCSLFVDGISIHTFFTVNHTETCAYYLSRHMKKGDLMVFPFLVLQCACAVLYLGYRYGFFWLELPQGLYYMSVNSTGSGETEVDMPFFAYCFLKVSPTFL